MAFSHKEPLPESTHRVTSDEQDPPDRPIPWDPSECRKYLVNVVGDQERLPQKVPYEGGSTALLERLGQRYGEDYLKSSSQVLRQFLEDPSQGSPEERAIWSGWRVSQAAKVVCAHLHF